jgi:hypothetical protein
VLGVQQRACPSDAAPVEEREPLHLNQPGHSKLSTTGHRNAWRCMTGVRSGEPMRRFSRELASSKGSALYGWAGWVSETGFELGSSSVRPEPALSSRVGAGSGRKQTMPATLPSGLFLPPIRFVGSQSFYRAFGTVNGGKARETDLFEGIGCEAPLGRKSPGLTP